MSTEIVKVVIRYSYDYSKSTGDMMATRHTQRGIIAVPHLEWDLSFVADKIQQLEIKNDVDLNNQ